MSQISPYARSTVERSKHWQTTALFMGVVAAIFLAATSLVTPSLKFWESESGESSDDSHRSASETVETKSIDSDAENAIDWSARIAAIEQELPDSDNDEVKDLQKRLQSLTGILESERPSTKLQETIQDALSRLQQQAVMLRAQSNRPTANADGFAERLASTAQSIRMAEHEAIRQAIENAERLVRKQKEKMIRDERLAVRDYQDESVNLRQRISQIQREQTLSLEREQRVAALARDMADVRKYLKPFTSPGHVQPNKTFSPVNITITADAMPVSLSALNEFNALENTLEGLKRLHRFGGANSAAVRNDRPFGEFPAYPSNYVKNPEVLVILERAQQLLRDHGQALVDAKLLSP